MEAFGEVEGPENSWLVGELLEDSTAMPILSLVAEQGNQVVGSAIFSTIHIEAAEDVGAYILCPLAVVPECQGAGVGTLLINRGLRMLKDRGAALVMVLGDPNYYSRTGFRSNHGIVAPYELLDADAWMGLELIDGALSRVHGKIRCALSLSSPEYW
jgi:predicted N-acetyltransferase YhbS